MRNVFAILVVLAASSLAQAQQYGGGGYYRSGFGQPSVYMTSRYPGVGLPSAVNPVYYAPSGGQVYYSIPGPSPRHAYINTHQTGYPAPLYYGNTEPKFWNGYKWVGYGQLPRVKYP